MVQREATSIGLTGSRTLMMVKLAVLIFQFTILLSGRENCAYSDITSYNPTWQDGNCAITQGFMCETVAGTLPPTTAPAPTLPHREPCNENDDPWIRMPGNDEFCYAFFGDYDSYTYIGKTWTKAEANCSQMGGHLASIHSVDENNFIMVEVSGLYV